MLNRLEIPTNPVELVLARKLIFDNKNPSLNIDEVGNIVPRSKDSVADYTVIVRKSTNSGDRSRNAKNLMACKGLKGCEFAQCAEKAFGKLSKNLEGLCSVESIRH